MRRLRFHCGELQTGRVRLDADESHHARDVMRVRAGDIVELFDGEGRTASATITALESGGVVATVDRIEQAGFAKGCGLTLVTALPRRPRQPFLFEKCTELGVARLVLANYERSTVRATVKGVSRWRRWTIEAAKQCGSLLLPRIDVSGSVSDSIGIVDDSALRLVCDPRAVDTLAARLNKHRKDAVVWIGPEGGLTDGERSTLSDCGVAAVRLCSNVLRIETACLTVAAIHQGVGPDAVDR